MAGIGYCVCTNFWRENGIYLLHADIVFVDVEHEEKIPFEIDTCGMCQKLCNFWNWRFLKIFKAVLNTLANVVLEREFNAREN